MKPRVGSSYPTEDRVFFTMVEYGEIRTKWYYSCEPESCWGYAAGTVDMYC